MEREQGRRLVRVWIVAGLLVALADHTLLPPQRDAAAAFPAQATPVPMVDPPTPTLAPFCVNPPAVPATVVTNTVILAPRLDLREGPDKGYPSVGHATKSEGVLTLGQYADCAWLYVANPRGEAGWMQADKSRVRLSKACDRIPHAPFRPFTGTVLQPAGKTDKDQGNLTADNQSGQDGLVILAQVDKPLVPVAAAYVRHSDSVTITRIHDGVYIGYFSRGCDWDGDERAFTSDVDYNRFEETFPYTTTRTTLPGWRITLHGVISGTAQTKDTSKDQFPSLKPTAAVTATATTK